MTLTIADRRAIPEVTGLPPALAFKAAASETSLAETTLDIDEARGVVTAIVSVTGVVDEVDDVIVPGAYAETLAKRRPKVCWAHSWEHPIGRVLYIEELLPGDERLPKTQRDGSPWPAAAGALVAVMQFNLRADEGRNAFEVVRFYSESGECEYSIGYNVPPGRASTDGKGTRFIKMLELYELSVVLFGAHTMTGTLSIKAAANAARQSKRLSVMAVRKAGIDMGLLAKASLRPPVVSVRAGTSEGKAPVPPQFQKREEGEPAEGDKPTPVKPTVTEKPDLVNDADTNLTATCPGCEQEVVFDTGNGWQALDGSYSHDDDTTHSDWLLPPDEAAQDPAEGDGTLGGGQKQPVGNAGPEQVAVEPSAGSAAPPVAPEAAPEAGVAPEKPETPDFSDGIMVAIYPDPSAADAVAAHIAGPDETTERHELHVTLAYLGKIGDSGITEQQIIDAVTRAVEGHPPLEGSVGGIGQFPPSEGSDGRTPTYAPVDLPGLGLLREQIVSELGGAVNDEHGFTPHMTLGYDIGLIQPLPQTPLRAASVSVVYGGSRRDVTLGAPVPESKHRTFFDADAPLEAKSGDLWFNPTDVTLHVREDDEWKAADPMTTPPGFIVANAYEPALDVKTDGPRMSADLVAAMEGKAEGGADRNRGGAETLRRYWTVGEGGLKIGWNTPGDFTRCVALLDEHMPGRAEGYCANRHKEMTGVWPGDDNNKGVTVGTESKVSPVPADVKSYPQMPGSYEERQQAIRQAIEMQYVDDLDEHGHRQVWVDLRATWADRVLYAVDRFGSGGSPTEHFLATYRMDEGGSVTFGQRDEVDLMVVPVLTDGSESEEDVPLGDTLPLVEDVLGLALAIKSAQRGMEGKAGRVLSGANERALRTAMTHLIEVLAAAGVDLGEVTPENPRPMGNTGGSGDVRREIDPAVDLETTSPSASTKSHPAKSGEVLTIDVEAHRALLASIEEASHRAKPTSRREQCATRRSY